MVRRGLVVALLAAVGVAIAAPAQANVGATYIYFFEPPFTMASPKLVAGGVLTRVPTVDAAKISAVAVLTATTADLLRASKLAAGGVLTKVPSLDAAKLAGLAVMTRVPSLDAAKMSGLAVLSNTQMKMTMTSVGIVMQQADVKMSLVSIAIIMQKKSSGTAGRGIVPSSPLTTFR